MANRTTNKPALSAAELNPRLEGLAKTLHNIQYVTLSTTNADGSPLCTPVFGTLDRKLNAYWSSHPGSLHSLNIARDPRVFAVIYDSVHGGAGLYIQGEAACLERGPDLHHAHEVLDRRCRELDHPIGPLGHYQGPGIQRHYQLIPTRFWINYSVRDEQGLYLRDWRLEVDRKQIQEVYRG
jgi:hypothetical protein